MSFFGTVRCAGCLALGFMIIVTHAAAVPPPGVAVGAALPKARWIEHRVVLGDRLARIAERYNVKRKDIIAWNKLDADDVRIRAGQQLHIFTRARVFERKKIHVRVKRGESWNLLARRYNVDERQLRDVWNGDLRVLKPGDRVMVWAEFEVDGDGSAAVERERPASASRKEEATASADDASAASQEPSADRSGEGDSPDKAAQARVREASSERATRAASDDANSETGTRAKTEASSERSDKPVGESQLDQVLAAVIGVPSGGGRGPLTLRQVRQNAESVGSPGRGRLRRGVQMPQNDALYTLRRPEHSYGSSHTVDTLQRAVHSFRKRSAYSGELIIADMSRKRGGRFRPHNSHRSGRDVDIQLPKRDGVPEHLRPEREAQVDWDAAWALVDALLETGAIKYIFLSRPRQDALYKAARRAGRSEEELKPLLQYPHHTRTSIIRHARGHTAHIHVRFVCGPNESRCRN